jgi:hypothetical protein
VLAKDVQQGVLCFQISFSKDDWGCGQDSRNTRTYSFDVVSQYFARWLFVSVLPRTFHECSVTNRCRLLPLKIVFPGTLPPENCEPVEMFLPPCGPPRGGCVTGIFG